ncbi:MAG: hypothetical protein HY713_14035 [candidate division NC10 bacterium]|nr:hypothetical protein [candidate division NC10 bacterium]
MADRFSAFTFVDRITEIEPGTRARGCFNIPDDLPDFSLSLVSEAIGQLTAWVAMAHLEFRRRPVTGLAGEVRILGTGVPGRMLDLEVAIESCDDDAVAYGGWASVGGAPVVKLSRCVGPMLPHEEFDDPEAVRADFETLCGPGAPPGRFRGVPSPDFGLTDRDPGKRLRGVLQVPASAPLFADHFPRRAVYPGTLLLDSQVRLGFQLAGEARRSNPGASLTPSRVLDLKVRSFILPGQVVELEAEMLSEAGGTATAALAARVGGKLVSTARAEFIPQESS